MNGKDGTGKRAKSDKMLVAGKTGTANIPNSITGKYDNSEKMMSFCGFFPADEPQYSLLIQMMYDLKQDTRPDSLKIKLGGGSTAAVAFKEIAEKIMAHQYDAVVDEAKDTVNVREPEIKAGSLQNSAYLLKELKISAPKLNGKDTAWGTISFEEDSSYTFKERKLDIELVPNVQGMGAKDATYLMQERGLKVELDGYGEIAKHTCRTEGP